MLFTVVIAILFTILQGLEYAVSCFTISDGIYGSCFYFGTGFHGLYLLIASAVLYKIYYLTTLNKFS